jgi:type I restriction enzyme S subunit
MAKQAESKVPRIRFKGFSEKWIEKPIGDILSETKRPMVLMDDQRYELITVKRRNEGIVSRGHLCGRQILVKNYSRLKAGDFVISKRQVVHGATGIVPPELDQAIVSNEYLVAVGNHDITSHFLTLLSSRPDMRRKFFLSSYGVDIEKLVFDTDDWRKRIVTIPDLSEQTQIDGYFQELDRLIGLHQRKHEKLVTLKIAMLHKMFPQSGALTPEIRFNGFSGAWIEKSFKLIATRAAHAASDGRLPHVEYEDIIAGTGRLNKDITKKVSSKKGIKFEKGNVLFGKLRPYLRNWFLANFEGIAVGDFWVLEATTVEPDFLYSLIQTEPFERIANQSAGSKMPRSDWTLVSNRNFLLPADSQEQKEIGTYFRTLDELIYKYALQLHKVRQIKSAFLERMFV